MTEDYNCLLRSPSKGKCHKTCFPRTQQNGKIGLDPGPRRSQPQRFQPLDNAADFPSNITQVPQIPQAIYYPSLSPTLNLSSIFYPTLR